MTDDDLVSLATRYFTALDRRDCDALADTLADSCLLIIETHNIIHDGKQAICALFESRWTVPSDRMVKARHQDVIHSPSQSSGRITSQFTVTYSGPDAPPRNPMQTYFPCVTEKLPGSASIWPAPTASSPSQAMRSHRRLTGQCRKSD